MLGAIKNRHRLRDWEPWLIWTHTFGNRHRQTTFSPDANTEGKGNISDESERVPTNPNKSNELDANLWTIEDPGLVRLSSQWPGYCAHDVSRRIYKYLPRVTRTLVCGSGLGCVWAISRHFGDIQRMWRGLVTCCWYHLNLNSPTLLGDGWHSFKVLSARCYHYLRLESRRIISWSMQPHFIVTSNGVFWFQIKLFATVANKMNIANWVFPC